MTPQEIATQVGEAAMHKHAGKKGKPNRYKCWHKAGYSILLASVSINNGLAFGNNIPAG